MRSHGYKTCPDCGAGLRDGRKQFCSPCGDKRREERETRYRKARQALTAELKDDNVIE
jgi:uncharacterized membrane protein YvbJ